MEFDNERPSLDSEAKRRKLRKGTRSCWECKRRKVRCTFASETDAVCITCRGRGIKCVGQEHPEEVRLAEKGDGADRMMRVEALLDRLVKTVDHSTEKDESPSTSDHYESHPQLSLRTDSLVGAVNQITIFVFSLLYRKDLHELAEMLADITQRRYFERQSLKIHPYPRNMPLPINMRRSPALFS